MRFIAILLLLISSLLLATPAQSARVTISSSAGDHLLEACASMSDFRTVSTKGGKYNGCCSKSLGYCVLCPARGECFKFDYRRVLPSDVRDVAPDNNVVTEDRAPSRFTKRLPGRDLVAP